MGRTARRRGLEWVLMGGVAAWLGACSSGIPEVWVMFQEDDTLPCLGAAHLKVEVYVQGEKKEEFHRRGIFFSVDNQHCKLLNELEFSGLPQSAGIEVSISLFDSTLADPSSNPAGLLSQGASLEFNVEEGNWIRQLYIKMTRNAGSQAGTVVVTEPTDWARAAGVKHLRCSLSGSSGSRETLIDALEEGQAGSPFPLFISGIPLTGAHDLTLTALDGQNSSLGEWSRTGISMEEGKLWTIDVQ